MTTTLVAQYIKFMALNRGYEGKPLDSGGNGAAVPAPKTALLCGLRWKRMKKH